MEIFSIFSCFPKVGPIIQKNRGFQFLQSIESTIQVWCLLSAQWDEVNQFNVVSFLKLFYLFSDISFCLFQILQQNRIYQLQCPVLSVELKNRILKKNPIKKKNIFQKKYFPNKILAHSVQPFGQLQLTYIHIYKYTSIQII